LPLVILKMSNNSILNTLDSIESLRQLNKSDLFTLSEVLRTFIINAVAAKTGHFFEPNNH